MAQRIAARSPEEELAKAFALFDEDASGAIDEAEFEALIKCLLVGKSYASDTLNSLLTAEFEAADASGKQEVIAKLTRLTPGSDDILVNWGVER